MAHRSFRRAASALVLTVSAGAALGACSEQSSPLAPVDSPTPSATAPNALLGIPLGGIVGGLLDIVGGVVRGVVNGLSLPKPMNPTAFAAVAKSKGALHVAVSHGLATVPALTCTSQTGASQTMVVGPEGGVIRVGRHELSIPAGALSSRVAITASFPTGTSLGLDFAPHGLQFATPVQITLDYTGCAVPVNSYLNVVYSDATSGTVVLDGMPSLDSATTRRIVTLTDHFSGYIVAWGRQ